MEEGANPYTALTGADLYPREYIHALRTMIDRKDAGHALAVARMLVEGGHEARVWKCYTKMFFRLGIALHHPYLVDVFIVNADPAHLSGHVAAHERAIDILVRATRDRAPMRFVFYIAAHLEEPPAPAPVDANQKMFKSMHNLCTPNWVAHVAYLQDMCEKTIGILPKTGPKMTKLMHAWRQTEPDWHFGSWKYVMATLGLFLFFQHRCDMSQTSKYHVPAEYADKWPPAVDPGQWADEYRMPAHRQPGFGWPHWVRRAPRTLLERVGEDLTINSEHPSSLRKSSARIAQDRMHEIAVTRLHHVISVKNTMVYGYSNNPAMNMMPSRLSGAFVCEAMRGFEQFDGVSVIRMNSEEEACDFEAWIARMRDFWSASGEVFVFPVVREKGFLVVPFLFENQLTTVEEEYFVALFAVASLHRMPVHRASILRTDEPVYYINPFVGQDDDIASLVQPVPEEVRHFVAESINNKEF